MRRLIRKAAAFAVSLMIFSPAIGQEQPGQDKLVQCASLQEKLNKNQVLSDDEIGLLTECSVIVDPCAPAMMCTPNVPKDFREPGNPGDIGSDWNSLYPS